MLTFNITNSRPANHAILAQRLICSSVVLPPSVDKGNFCWCRYSCNPIMKVFAGDTNIKNDKSDFLFYRIGASDTVVMRLWKEGVNIANLDNNDYGTYYNFGSLANADLKGYLVDWGLVYTAFGAGKYQIKATSTLLGTVYNFESSEFSLSLYNELAANGTIRIESYQNGYTESSLINFTGVNWYSQARLRGNMRDKQPTLTVVNYQDSLRQKHQIQDSITNKYTLELPFIREDLKDVIVENVLLANEVAVTDYNIVNNNRYQPINLYPSEIDKLNYRGNLPGCSLFLKFTDKRDNILKRNVF